MHRPMPSAETLGSVDRCELLGGGVALGDELGALARLLLLFVSIAGDLVKVDVLADALLNLK